ncbi:MAG: hypothetical protein LAO31_07395 [Acidobacteriia bacterium]|nr:hypothetical protein [Terriglobia bacterium]
MRALVSILTVVLYMGLVAFVLWLIAIRPRLPVRDKIAGLLKLVAVYTLLFGLLSSSGVFKEFDGLQRELTSPDPLIFLRGNLSMFIILFGSMSVALDPNSKSSELRQLLGTPVLIAESLGLFAYAIIHFLAIAPIAYFAYLVTSVPIDAILNSGSDIEIRHGVEAIRIKALVVQNETAIRNFAVALPAFAVSLLLNIWPLLRRGGHAPK